VFLTLPALVVSALLLFVIVQPMTGLSAASGWALLCLALALPILCTFGPARGWSARARGHIRIGWVWLLSPVICFAAIAVLVISIRA
jgi:hypothetical protein